MSLPKHLYLLVMEEVCVLPSISIFLWWKKFEYSKNPTGYANGNIVSGRVSSVVHVENEKSDEEKCTGPPE